MRLLSQLINKHTHICAPACTHTYLEKFALTTTNKQHRSWKVMCCVKGNNWLVSGRQVVRPVTMVTTTHSQPGLQPIVGGQLVALYHSLPFSITIYHSLYFSITLCLSLSLYHSLFIYLHLFLYHSLSLSVTLCITLYISLAPSLSLYFSISLALSFFSYPLLSVF